MTNTESTTCETKDAGSLLLQYLCRRASEWRLVELPHASFDKASGWLTEDGKIKVFLLVGKVVSADMRREKDNDAWNMELELPTYVAGDFDHDLTDLYRSFCDSSGKETLARAGDVNVVRLERDYVDFDSRFIFPNIFDHMQSSSSNLNHECPTRYSAISPNALVACTAFAKKKVLANGRESSRFILEAVRLLGRKKEAPGGTSTRPDKTFDV
ncbi:hypothetical protein P7C70_g9316, partial [Phenoliferia sp. Uapishka_3]